MTRHAVSHAPLSRGRLAALLLTAVLAAAALLPARASGQEVADSARHHRHANPAGDATALRVVGDDPADVDRIRGLGYIGLMATGAHHRRHHWMIATGREPHGGE